MLTLSAVADKKGIGLKSLEVTVKCETSEALPISTRFDVTINLGDQLTDREKKILFNSARRCEVSKMLTGTIGFSHQLVSSPEESDLSAAQLTGKEST